MGIHIKKARPILVSLVFALTSVAAFGQEVDPPTRVIRLNLIEGAVSMEPAGIDEWAPAVVNRPFYTGDYLYADNSSRAELHSDVAAIRLGPLSNIGILNLTDTAMQIKLTQGDLEVTLHDFDQYQTFEVDTPNSAINFLRTGVYRVHVDPEGNTTWLNVRSGQAEVTGGGQAFAVNSGAMASMAGSDNQMSYDIQALAPADEFDQWVSARDARFAHRASARYLPPTVIGYEDLDDYGSWAPTPQYGQVWYPTTVAAGWSPYHAGHWAWVEPWGWTWVDDAPWGFAPFHYGRWVYVGARWGWAPGPMVIAGGYGRPIVRPCYAPAMVAWFGGAHFGVSIAVGSAPSVGWVPLGWGEVYTPSYHVSQRYFSNVNVYNTRVVNNVNITNVYKTVYVNKTVYNQTFVNVRAPNAVVAMPQTALATGRPVAQNAAVLRPEQVAHLQTAQAVVVAPSAVPTQHAVAPTLGTAATPHPTAQAVTRPVVARNIPPQSAPSFTARQSYLQQHAGQPLNTAEMRNVVMRPAVQQVASVKQAPPAKPVPVSPGQHFGLPKAQVAATANPGLPNSGTANPHAAQPHAAQLEEARPRPAPSAPGVPTAHGVAPTAPGSPAEHTTASPHSKPPQQPVETEPRPAASVHGVPPVHPASPNASEGRAEHPTAAPHANAPEPHAQPEAREPVTHGAQPSRPTEPPAERAVPHEGSPTKPPASQKPQSYPPASQHSEAKPHGTPPPSHETSPHPKPKDNQKPQR